MLTECRLAARGATPVGRVASAARVAARSIGAGNAGHTTGADEQWLLFRIRRAVPALSVSWLFSTTLKAETRQNKCNSKDAHLFSGHEICRPFDEWFDDLTACACQVCSVHRPGDLLLN